MVALLDRSDPDHELCRRALTTIRDPLVTAWPAITEAMYLLGRVSWAAPDSLWEFIEHVRVLPLGERDAPRMRALMEKYRSLPMDLADAAIVALAEREVIRRVFTLDVGDFRLYRPAGIGRFSLFPSD